MRELSALVGEENREHRSDDDAKMVSMRTTLNDEMRRAWLAVAASAEMRAFVAACLGRVPFEREPLKTCARHSMELRHRPRVVAATRASRHGCAAR